MNRLFATLLALSLAAAPAVRAEEGAAVAKGEAAEEKPAAETTYLFQGQGRTADEEEQYRELSEALQAYEEQTREFRREVQLLIEKKYDEKRRTLEASYEKAITDVEILERKERLDAIAMFEEFLKRYPNDPQYTPDVMFRLAELYYEKTKDDYAVAMRDFEAQLREAEAAGLTTQPPEPRQSFEKSIALYERLLAQFPAYHLNDGSLYLLGFCLEKQGDLERSRDTFHRLIASYPRSRFVPEAWVRIGEYYFDAIDEENPLPKAAHAYGEAVKFKDHPLYDKALYKLGWTWYRLDEFDRAVDAFVELVDFYEREAQQAGDEEVGGDLRNEALQYMAISFADERWGSLAKAHELFARIGPRRWEPELWRRLGNVYYDQTKFTDSVAALKQSLAKDPTHPEAPLIQDKIVKAYETGLRDFQSAFAERDLLVKNYAPGSPWYEANKDDSDVLRAAQELSEKSLYSSAVYHHQQAIEHAKNERFDLAKMSYEIAATGYGEYLARFPHSKLAYELQFYQAECLYYSLQFLAAAEAYEKVRDSTADNKYQAEAAYAAVLSYQREIEGRQRANPPTLETRPILTSKDRPADRPVKREELPELWKRFVAAADGFLASQPKHERAPQIAYRAAEIYYAYDDFEEARRRFAKIAELYGESEFGTYASNLTLETFLITEDWVAVTDFTDRLTRAGEDGKARVDPASEAGKILRDFGDNAMFKQAEKLMAEGRWDEAGDLYEQLVTRNRGYRFADKALNNAAVCRERARRFDSALRLYERIYNEYPKSELADVALFRVAVNAENSYDFDKAVERYSHLVENYPKSKDRAAALNNLARLLEGLQRYKEAAAQFTRYAQLFPGDEDAPKNLYRAATIYEKMDDCRGQIRALNDFVKRFASDNRQSERVVDAWKRIGDCHRTLKNEKAALQAWATATREYVKRGLTGADVAGSAAAAYSRFQLAEADFKKWDAITLTGRGKALERAFENKTREAKMLQDSYSEVYAFKSVEWILAASYKKGYILERFATSLIESPCPPDVERAYGEEGCMVYQQELVAKVTGLEERAAEAYETTVTECRKFQLIDNEWCDRTQESLSRYRAEFRVLKKARSITVDSTSYPSSLVETPEGPALKQEQLAPAKIGEEL